MHTVPQDSSYLNRSLVHSKHTEQEQSSRISTSRMVSQYQLVVFSCSAGTLHTQLARSASAKSASRTCIRRASTATSVLIAKVENQAEAVAACHAQNNSSLQVVSCGVEFFLAATGHAQVSMSYLQNHSVVWDSQGNDVRVILQCLLCGCWQFQVANMHVLLETTCHTRQYSRPHAFQYHQY